MGSNKNTEWYQREFKEVFRQINQRYPGLCGYFLFGSLKEGEDSPTDVDVFCFYDSEVQPLSEEERIQILDEMEAECRASLGIPTHRFNNVCYKEHERALVDISSTKGLQGLLFNILHHRQVSGIADFDVTSKARERIIEAGQVYEDFRKLMERQGLDWSLERIKMSETDIGGLLTLSNVGNIASSIMASGISSLHIEGKLANVSEVLGCGGTKRVYNVEVGGRNYAVALPGTVDPAEITITKWNKVLQEPANTDRLRELGFHVNDICRIAPAEINGHEFPVLMMKRYRDHDFPIFDSKNPCRHYHEFIKPEQKVTDEDCLQLFSAVGDEIAALVQNGVGLGNDCFNLCEIDGVIHLYFNDLGPARFEDIPARALEVYVSAYARAAVGAFVNTTTERVYSTNPYVNSMGDLSCTLHPVLAKRVMKTIEEKLK